MRNFFFRLLKLYQAWRRFKLRLLSKTEEDIHKQRVIQGKSWEEFCDNLKSAGAALVHGNAPQDAFHQAEGLRYLSRLTRAGLEAFVEYSDPAFPILRRMVHETVKMGADNPDNYYLNAQITGEYEYRIWGKRGTVNYLGFGTQRGSYGTTGGLQAVGYLEGAEMNIEEDGSFEIILSPEKKGQNWLPISPDTSMIMVRQTFLNREEEKRAELNIECLGGPKTPRPLSPKQIDEGLKTASLLVSGASIMFSRWANGFKKHSNQLPLFDPQVSNDAGGDANITYYHSHWQLAPDEALLIEAQPPECEHWNFQLNNYWMESLDYRYFNIHINKHSAQYKSDGSVQIIVAHQDPGLDNWINTVGHNEGTMCFRWVKAKHAPQPQTRVLKFEDLAKLT